MSAYVRVRVCVDLFLMQSGPLWTTKALHKSATQWRDAIKSTTAFRQIIPQCAL